MLKLTTKTAVRLSWADDSMEAIFTLNPGDSQEELVSKLERIVNFVHDREGKPALPERLPGFALGMAQEAHPAPPGNGWAVGAQMVPPELPADRQGEWELIPEDEQE
jgi:hypothetical protein